MDETNAESQEALKDLFDCFDLNKDGRITLEELLQVMEWLGETPNPVEVETMFHLFDTDHSDSLEYDEFCGIITVAIRDEKESAIRIEYMKVFNHFDRDKDGFITAPDLHLTMKELGENITDEEMHAMMVEAKADKQGKIDFKSFKRLMKSLDIKEPTDFKRRFKCMSKCVIL